MSALFPTDEDIYSDHEDYGEQDYGEEDYDDYDGDGDLEMNDDAPGEQSGRQKLTHKELLDLNNRVEKNLEIKWKMVPGRFEKPSLHDIYFNAAALTITWVDPDLQLPYYFSNFNSIARWGFVAQKTTMQPFDISRAIFYYGLDSVHTFERYFEQMRWNIILMAFVWASGFDTKYCKAGCEKFVKLFIGAWLETLVYEHEVIDTRKRDAFFLEWKHGPFDLYFFNQRDKDKMKRRLKWLQGKLSELEDNGPRVKNYIQALKDGQIDEPTFEKYGAALSFQWMMSHETTANKDQSKKNEEHGLGSQPDDYVEEGQLSGRQGKTLTLDQVDWDSDMVNAILEDIDPTLEMPKDKKLHQREVNPGQFWITTDQVFNAVFGVEQRAEEQSAEVDMMAQMMAHKLAT